MKYKLLRLSCYIWFPINYLKTSRRKHKNVLFSILLTYAVVKNTFMIFSIRSGETGNFRKDDNDERCGGR